MKFKSAVYTQVSGSVGGLTYAHNRGGMYARARSLVTNPNTEAQQAVRDAVRELTDAWTNVLTDSDRDAWNLYAFNTPMLNKLGDLTKRSGQNMYIRGNTPRLQAGLDRVDSGPAVFDLGSFTPLVVSAAAAGDHISLAFTDTDEWANEDGSSLLIYQSRPQNATKRFFAGPYQLMTRINGSAMTPPTSPVVATSLFALEPGQRVFLRITCTRADGRYSLSQQPDAVVT